MNQVFINNLVKLDTKQYPLGFKLLLLSIWDGKSQNTDFDGQVAYTTLALVTHTVLTLQKRFGDYETMGILFR